MRPPPRFSAGLPGSVPTRSAPAQNPAELSAPAKKIPPPRQFFPEQSTDFRCRNTAQAAAAAVRRPVALPRWLAPGRLSLPKTGQNSDVKNCPPAPTQALVRKVAVFDRVARKPPWN